MAPIIVTEFAPGVTLRQPLRLDPFLSDDEQLLHLQDAEPDTDDDDHAARSTRLLAWRVATSTTSCIPRTGAKPPAGSSSTGG